MTFTFLDQRIVLEWPMTDMGGGSYRHPVALSALAVTADSDIVIADIVLDPAGQSQGNFGWWTDLRVVTAHGTVLHPNIYQTNHYRNVVAMVAGEVSPGVVGILLWEAEEAYSSGGHQLPLERVLFFRVNATTGGLLGATIHPAVFSIPGTTFYLYPIDRGQWGGVCEQVGNKVVFRLRVGTSRQVTAPIGSFWYRAEFALNSSGGLDYTVSPWPPPRDGNPDYAISTWAHGVGVIGEYGFQGTVCEVDSGAVHVPGTSTGLPYQPSVYTGATIARQSGKPVFHMVRGLAATPKMQFELLTVATTVPPPDGPPNWWEGNYGDWRAGWGEGSLGPVVYPEIRGGIIVIPNPDDPDGDPWAWANLPPGAGLNDWMQFYADGQYIRIMYGGRVVLVWKMPQDFYDRMVAGGAFGGFYNPYTKQWSPTPPPGVPPWKPVPLEGWNYQVDTRRRDDEKEYDNLTRHGSRVRADDLLFFPDRVVGGEYLQDDLITAAPVKYLGGRVLPPVIVDSVQAGMAYDAGYAYALYPVGPS